MPTNPVRVVKLHKFGPSHAITIPAEFCRALGAVRGNLMRLDLLDDAVIVRRQDETPIRLKHALPKLGPGAAFGRR